MEHSSPIGFRLIQIETVEFATQPDKETDSELSLETGVSVQALSIDSALRILFRITFARSGNPLVILEIACIFHLSPSSFQALQVKPHQLKIPVGLARHLAMLTVGTCRGILFEKLQKTPYANLLLPTIDLTELLPEDLVLDADRV